MKKFNFFALLLFVFTISFGSKSEALTCKQLGSLAANSPDCQEFGKPRGTTQPSNSANTDSEVTGNKVGGFWVNNDAAGKKDVLEVELYKDGVKANFPEGSVLFVAKFGFGTSKRLLQIDRMIIDTGVTPSRNIAVTGKCLIDSLKADGQSRGMFLGYNKPDKFTQEVTSKYMTDAVACETSDSKGNKYLMKGAVIVNY